MAHIPKERRRKWDPKSEEYIFVGYADETKGYRLLDKKTKKVVIRRDVTFIENELKDIKVQHDISKKFVPLTDTSDKQNEENFSEDSSESDEERDTSHYSSVADEQSDESDNEEQTTQLRRSKRIPVPKSYKDYYLYSTQSDFSDPITVEEALNSPDAIKWKEAMNKEFESLRENNTWNLGKLPSDRKAIQTKWIFKRKMDSDGNIAQFKTR